MEIYLDNSATTRPYKRVVETVAEIMSRQYGNPSSLHRLGIEAEKVVKTARAHIAETIKAAPGEIFFTSGGTESNNLAIMGICGANRGRHIISTPVEHPATMNTLSVMRARGYRVDYLPVSREGLVDLAAFENLIDDDTVLVTAMHVNNEIGTVEPIEEMVRILKQKNPQAYFHLDAVQSYCKLPVNVNQLNVDLISLSAHKIHGPNGVGALYVRKSTKIAPIAYGGGQQNGLRPGTENVAGIAGFGVAAHWCSHKMAESVPKMAALRNRLAKGITANIPDVQINTPQRCAPHILNVSFAGIKAEVLLHALETEQIYVSSGSACSSHKKGEPSYVLEAIGLDRKMIGGSIRFSLSEFTTEADIDKTVSSLTKMVAQLRRLHVD